jgi:hypothetical protein
VRTSKKAWTEQALPNVGTILLSFLMSLQGSSATNTSAGKCHLRLAFQPEPSAKDGVDRLHHAMIGVAPDVGMTQKQDLLPQAWSRQL